MKRKRTLLLTLIGALAGFQTGRAEEGTDNLAALKQQLEQLEQKVLLLERQAATQAEDPSAKAKEQQIQELDQKLRILERKRELEQEAAAEAAKTAKTTAPVITAGPNGLSVRSADTNFVFTLRGLVQVDSRTFFDNGGIRGVDGFILRRARPIFQGTVFRDFDFMFVPDFGGSTVQIQDAYLNYRYSPEAQLQVGKYKVPVGLEHLQSDPVTSFNERSLATDLVPNRCVGAALRGDISGGVVSYAAGVFNSTTDYNGTTTNANFDNNVAFAGRLFLQPFKQSSSSALKGFGVGVGGSYEIDEAWTNTASTGLTPGFTTDGQQRFFAYTNGVVGRGVHWRASPQGYYYCGPVGLLGEYVISDQEVRNVPRGLATRLQNTAWQVSGGWMLTGEDASFTGITPKRPFDPRNGKWGAFQLVGRYAELQVDSDTFPDYANPAVYASSAKSWAAGLNWYLNRNLRFNLSYSHTKFEGGNGASATVTKQPEQVLFTRVQLAF